MFEAGFLGLERSERLGVGVVRKPATRLSKKTKLEGVGLSGAEIAAFEYEGKKNCPKKMTKSSWATGNFQVNGQMDE